MKKFFSNALIKNSAIIFTGTMIANFGAYLYHVLVGRILGPEKYGEIAALLSLLFIISVPANVLQTVVTKYFSIYKAENSLGQAKALLFSVTKYLFIFSLIFVVLYILLIPFLQTYLHIQSGNSLLWLGGIFITFIFTTELIGVLIGYQKFFSASLLSSASMGLRLISGIWLASYGVSWVLFGNVIANIFSMFFYFFSVRFLLLAKNESLHLKKKDAINYSIPTFIVSLGIILLYNIDVVLVKHYFSGENAGIYASLNVFGKIIFFASSAVGFVVFPMIAERVALKKAFHTVAMKGLLIVTSFSGVLVVIYTFFSAFVSNILFGTKFISASPYLGYYGLFMAGVTVSYFLGLVCLAINKTGIAKLVLVASVSQIIGLYLFHETLYQVVFVNCFTAIFLTLASLLYYFYETNKK